MIKTSAVLSLIFVGTIIILFVIIKIIAEIVREKNKALEKEIQKNELIAKTRNDAINSLIEKGFNVSKSWVLSESLSEIMFDDIGYRVALRNGSNFKLIKYADVLGFSLEEDGHTISTSTSETTTEMGAMEATSVPTVKNNNTCSSLYIRLFINDFNNPHIKLHFISSDTYKYSPEYSASKTRVQEVTDVLTSIRDKVKSGEDDAPAVIINPVETSISGDYSDMPAAIGHDGEDNIVENITVDVGPNKDEAEEWYYISGTQVIGPFAENELMTHVNSGAINEDTLVWSSFFTYEGGWQRAADTKLMGESLNK